MGASYAGCDELLAVSLLTISIAGHGFNSVGGAINLLDLGPNYAAPLDAIINTLGTIVGICAPYIAGVMTPNVSFLGEKCVKVHLNGNNDCFLVEGIAEGMAHGVLDYVCASYYREYCFYGVRECQNSKMEFAKGLKHSILPWFVHGEWNNCEKKKHFLSYYFV